ncbi:hypothetical protein EYF80_042327 [Liparis tanakae]|uniref:Uncharacterized protein n=1 Tax=Liparis tanakae TaxID=230148 RepID=A0A4Z2G1R8_9TELE|nr:hypothetical protein EYF80_042327 [Liparis tanakae]
MDSIRGTETGPLADDGHQAPDNQWIQYWVLAKEGTLRREPSDPAASRFKKARQGNEVAIVIEGHFKPWKPGFVSACFCPDFYALLSIPAVLMGTFTKRGHFCAVFGVHRPAARAVIQPGTERAGMSINQEQNELEQQADAFGGEDEHKG